MIVLTRNPSFLKSSVAIIVLVRPQSISNFTLCFNDYEKVS